MAPRGVPASARHDIAFVLGGGGVLGANEVGMLEGLLGAGIHPDLIIGTSVGAINGALLAADPSPRTVAALAELWRSLSGSSVFGGSAFTRLATAARTRTHLHDAAPLRALLRRTLPVRRFEELAIPFQCVAASIELAAEHWFSSGPLIEAVMASCAVPGLLPAVKVGDEHYVDGGIVNSIPVGRAVELGARTVFVLQVGRIERPLRPPTKPWEVALVSFEIARRHRFARDMSQVPGGVTVHVLPTGEPEAPLANLRYRDTRKVGTRIARARTVTQEYLADMGLV